MSSALIDHFNDNQGALITHTAAATGATGADLPNDGATGVQVVVDVTAITGTAPSLTVFIEGKDRVTGKYFTVLESAALGAVGTTVLTVYPGVTATANVTASTVLPYRWRVRTVIAGTTPAVTATITASLVG